MKKLLLFVFITLVGTASYAQDPSDLSGNYYLEGGGEGVKSGFYLNKNYTFKFFFSKAGIERHGSGRWEADKNTIVFNGRVAPARVYKLYAAKRVNDNFVTLRFTDDNPDVLKNIECILYTARGRQKLFTNAEGVVKFTKQEVDSVQIKSPVFPDHAHTYIPNNKIQNSFEFGFEKSIFEVFFENFVLLNTTNGLLVGRHPLLKGNQFRYVKDQD